MWSKQTLKTLSLLKQFATSFQRLFNQKNARWVKLKANLFLHITSINKKLRTGCSECVVSKDCVLVTFRPFATLPDQFVFE